MRLRSRNHEDGRESESDHLPPTPPPSPVPNRKQNNQDAFNNIYKDLSQPGAYTQKIKRYLRQNVTHSLHKSVRKKFKRRRIITHYPGQIVQMDLIDMQKYYTINSHYKYILVVLDLFSKQLWMEPLKSKEGHETAQAIRRIFHKMTFPVQSVIFDEGKEFLNQHVNLLFAQFGIHSYSIHTKTKAGAVERVNKTIKNMIWKIFTETKKNRWIDKLEEIQRNYNSTYHRTIRMAPKEVTWENRKKVFKTMFPEIRDKINCRLKVGDKVRVALNKELFEKGYKVNWSEDIFTIVNSFQRGGVCWYRIKDKDNRIYPKGKYFFQLNKV